MSCQKEPWRPKDGPGPRGFPDCYYKSRVLNSTHRYVSFVKALRFEEAKYAAGDAIALLLRRDTQNSEFCTRSDRRNCINAVSAKVVLCMESYEEDLNKKRASLREQLTKEEEQNVSLMVARAQAGAEALARDKEKTLERLRLKSSTKNAAPRPSGCVPAELAKQRTKDEQIAHLYQMKEKQAMKMQQMELDHMWHEVAMKHDEAMGFRAEMDAVERYHRDMACKEDIDYQVNKKNMHSHANSLRLKEEAIRMKQKFDEDDDKAMKEELAVESNCRAVGQERADAIVERQAILDARRRADEILQNTFDELKDQSSEAIRQHIALRKRRAMEVRECNVKLEEMRNSLLKGYAQGEEDAAAITAAQQREDERQRRCGIERKRIAMIQGVYSGRDELREKEKVRQLERQKLKLDEYALSDATHQHLLRMDALQVEAEAAKRKKHQLAILQQIADKKAAREEAERNGEGDRIQPMGLIIKECTSTTYHQE